MDGYPVVDVQYIDVKIEDLKLSPVLRLKPNTAIVRNTKYLLRGRRGRQSGPMIETWQIPNNGVTFLIRHTAST